MGKALEMKRLGSLGGNRGRVEGVKAPLLSSTVRHNIPRTSNNSLFRPEYLLLVGYWRP